MKVPGTEVSTTIRPDKNKKVAFVEKFWQAVGKYQEELTNIMDQSLTHLTGKAFAFELSYIDTEGFMMFIPRATGLLPESVEVQYMVAFRLSWFVKAQRLLI